MSTTTPEHDSTTRKMVYDIAKMTLHFNNVTSLNNISLQIHRGEILAMIDPNGTDKTSLFNSLTNIYTPQKKTITLAARENNTITSVLNKKTHVINRIKMARTFQNIRLFPTLTTLKNIKIKVETRQKSSPISTMLRIPQQRRKKQESTERTYELLGFVKLTRRTNELAGTLAYSEQRRLEIARALGTKPSVILLNEPTADTNPIEKQELAALIQKINIENNISMLLIEHDIKLIMSMAHQLVMLNFGKKIAENTPEQIQRNPAMIAAYLSTSEDEAQQMTKRLEVRTIDVDASALNEPDTKSEENRP